METQDESGEEEEATNGPVRVDIPNTRIYGYDRYLTLNSYNYDGVLSISPLGTLFRFRNVG